MDGKEKTSETMSCPTCNAERRRFGKHRNGLQRYRCPECGKTYSEAHAKPLGSITVPMDKALLALQLLIEPSATPIPSSQLSAARSWS